METWNGINLYRVRNSFIDRLSGDYYTVRRLVDRGKNVDHGFDVETNGSVIVTDYYMTWEFIAPMNWPLEPGETVEDLFTNLETATTEHPVTSWDEFAVFLNGKRSTVNGYISEGSATTIKDANGQSYSGTMHKIPEVSTFTDLAVWFHSLMGAGILAADSGVMYSDSSIIQFTITLSGVEIACTFRL